MKSANKIIKGIIERYLFYKRCQVFNPNGIKIAVLSYVLFPKKCSQSYFSFSHNNRLMCKSMVNVLVTRGFKVYLYDYQDENVICDGVTLFIGHNRTFHSIASKMPPGCRKAFITTGSNPSFDNEQISLREAYFEARHGIKWDWFPMSYSHVAPNISAADVVLMMGNEFVVRTWPAEYLTKRFIYHNIINFRFTRKTGRKTTFLYMSNQGALRRGLDLAIDSFSELPYDLIICSPSHTEKQFFDYYAKIIDRCENIHYMGYVDTTSEQFHLIVDKSDFAFLPSCSEGESGSVLNLMAFGLLPVVTENVGFENVDRYGFKIQDCSIDGIRKLITEIVNSPNNLIEDKRKTLFMEMSKYTPEVFMANFNVFCESIMRPAIT